jgi:hypothetical protein
VNPSGPDHDREDGGRQHGHRGGEDVMAELGHDIDIGAAPETGDMRPIKAT